MPTRYDRYASISPIDRRDYRRRDPDSPIPVPPVVSQEPTTPLPDRIKEAKGIDDFENKDKGFATPSDYGAGTSYGDRPRGPRPGATTRTNRVTGELEEIPTENPPLIDQYTSWSSNTSYRGGGGMPAMGDFDATTREVQDEELVENRLTDLLASDSRYIQQARNDARMQAAERGGLNTNMWGESGVVGAIRSAGAIAESDANAYRMAASENLQARNMMTQAKLKAATQIAATQISAGATVAAANINAETSKYLAHVNNDHQKAMFDLKTSHDEQMENLRQGGRVELTEMSNAHQAWLQERGFDHDFSMADLSFDQKVEFEERFADPRFYSQLEFQKTQAQTQLGLGMMQLYASGMTSLNGQDIDSDAFARGEKFYRGLYESGFSLLKNLWGDDFDFDINFGGSP